MGDLIDDLMAKNAPVIKKQVDSGLALKPMLQAYVGVDALSESLPYRVTSVTWDEEPVEAPSTGPMALRRCNAEVEGARELIFTLDLEVAEMQDRLQNVLVTIQRFAQRARVEERMVMLALIAGQAEQKNVYNMETVKQQADRLRGACRLIASDKTAEMAKEQGIVEDVVNPHGSLPGRVIAMLVRLGGDGPLVRRVVDDLAFTWRRTSTSAVQLRLTERFFLDGANHAVAFVSRSKGAKAGVARGGAGSGRPRRRV